LLKELNVNDFDIKEINASKDNGVDFIRDTISRFCETMPYGEFKYVLLDESDGLSPAAQGTLRGVIEKYSTTVRFLLTCNYVNKIIPALHSRCQSLHIDKLDKEEYTLKVANILIAESITFDMDVIDSYVDKSYPDLRKCINSLQMNSYNGKLNPLNSSENSDDYKFKMVELFKIGKYKAARELICSQITIDEYEDVFRFMYENLSFWSATEDQEDKCLLVIRDGLAKHSLIADPEINLSATLTELSMIAKGIL